MRAARQSDVAVMQVLLEAGADVNLATARGMTPLMFVVNRTGGFRGIGDALGEPDVATAVALCLQHGARVDAVDDTGQTALHYAAASAGEDVVRLLAARGADLFAKDKQGRTPLDVTLGGGGRGGRNGGLAAAAEGQSVSEQNVQRAGKAALLRQLMGVAPKDAAQPR
jgi:hypothetical protein